MAITHLIHHPSGYIFRYCIPADVQHVIQRKELRYSLKTGSLRCAKARAGALVGYVYTLITEIRENDVGNTSTDQINSQFKARLKEITGQVPKNSRPGVSSIPWTVKLPTSSPQLSKVLKRHVAEAAASKQWSPKTTQEVISGIELFIQVVGNRQINSIGRPLVREYKETLMRLPSNLRKIPIYRNKSIPEILAMPPATSLKRLSPVTINKLLRRLSSFFRYAVKHGYAMSNPAEGMQLSIKKRQDEFRDAFSAEDLKALFCSKEYTQDGFRRGYQFWAPIIALYTGCRIEEICQLHLDDIKQEDGIWVLDINDDKEKKVKSLSAKRLIPLHPVLINKLYLLKYAGTLKAKGHARLFPNLKRQRDGYSQLVSKWFSRYRKRCGVDSPKKTFHSFRHTFITALKHKQVNVSILHELDGHALEGMTMARYGKRYTPRVLYGEAISRLDYPLDWSHLKGSRWVPRSGTKLS